VKAKYNGVAFVPYSHIDMPTGTPVTLTIQENTTEPKIQDSDSPISMSLLGILKGSGIKTADDIKDLRLKQYL
jgi:hypothetical protein